MLLTTIIVVIVVALVFDWTNGFHDAANAIATSVATRALTPRVALAMAAVMNLAGAFLGTQVASTVGSGIIAAPQGTRGLLDGVHHIVEGRGEAVDVLPVERRDERRVELHQDLAGEPVARQLGVLDPPREARPRARLGGHHQRERVGGHLDVLTGPGEQREEAVLDGSQPERHGRERYRGWITRRP